MHSIWTMAWHIGCGLFIVRVPSKENLADDPSRERYGLLKKMKADKHGTHIHTCIYHISFHASGNSGIWRTPPAFPECTSVGLPYGSHALKSSYGHASTSMFFFPCQVTAQRPAEPAVSTTTYFTPCVTCVLCASCQANAKRPAAAAVVINLV